MFKKLCIINILPIISLHNASEVKNFYCSRFEVFGLCISRYHGDRIRANSKESFSISHINSKEATAAAVIVTLEVKTAKIMQLTANDFFPTSGFINTR